MVRCSLKQTIPRTTLFAMGISQIPLFDEASESTCLVPHVSFLMRHASWLNSIAAQLTFA